ncbi:MAG: VOC family protein [Anaerolineae bacterium]|jgi:catechol 2,3-dioxygenase-like lactoylglutathione lyase family enzyme
MNQTLALISYVVRDYDEAIAFFTNVMQFELVEDTPQDNKRWVVVRPRGGTGASLLLAKADSPEQAAAIGNQTGGRVFLFLQTDDFQRDYERMRFHGVEIMEEPRHEVYGTVAVFKDLYGNKWDLLQPK